MDDNRRRVLGINAQVQAALFGIGASLVRVEPAPAPRPEPQPELGATIGRSPRQARLMGGDPGDTIKDSRGREYFVAKDGSFRRVKILGAKR